MWRGDPSECTCITLFLPVHERRVGKRDAIQCTPTYTIRRKPYFRFAFYKIQEYTTLLFFANSVLCIIADFSMTSNWLLNGQPTKGNQLAMLKLKCSFTYKTCIFITIISIKFTSCGLDYGGGVTSLETTLKPVKLRRPNKLTFEGLVFSTTQR